MTRPYFYTSNLKKKKKKYKNKDYYQTLGCVLVTK